MPEVSANQTVRESVLGMTNRWMSLSSRVKLIQRRRGFHRWSDRFAMLLSNYESFQLNSFLVRHFG